jgi:hypothetical protein
MPGGINANFYGGAQGEYLAQYLLSVIGSAIIVPRQIDDGKDFHCSVAREENGMLFFEFPFMIQIKTIGNDDAKTEELVFGEKSDKGKWKKYEIDWLTKQGLPLFIGLVSKKDNSLRIFSTSTMWFIFHTHPNPSRIKFSCRLDGSTHNVGGQVTNKLDNWNTDDGDGVEYTVDLGPPVVNVDVKTVWDKEYLKIQRNRLSASVEIEQLNILYRKLNVPYFTWLLNIDENRAGIMYPPVQPDHQISHHLSNVLFATAIVFMSRQQTDKLNYIKSLIKLLPREHFPLINEATSADLKMIINFLFDN